MIIPGRLWLVGCGNMAGAMLSRWIETGTVDAAQVFVVNREDRALPQGVRQGRSFPDEPLPGAVMLGMKPQQLGLIADTHGSRIAGVPLLLSILAGIEVETLAQRFEAGAIVRAMPNLPVALGKGVVALHGPHNAPAEALMKPLGLVEWIGDEALFDVVTALAGSGPGFVYRFIDALAAGGAALGVPADQARRLALATVEGSALLAAQSDLSPGTLADRVASPNGSTRKGLDVLDANGALLNLLRETLAASARRNAEMAAEARN
ncbi:pyrroline-5-carboxylate reductase family protein [Sphingomonas soli]|uniref:pyrroline-5-carboxylate reductase family protein n=1 Tax=Sphingomonas soli TaxID=266127 RepID=UPI00082EC581|nr:pyrroline-5-carboxylate reductase dimerization domain-containing protein [Sphingomonas soli]